MHHRHGVFDGDGLTTGGLNIQLGTAKAWENKRLFTHQQMGTVQLSTNVNTQIKVTHCREAVLVIGHRDGKVTAEADKRFRPTVDHGTGRLHRIMPMVRRRLKAKHLFQTVQEGRGGLLANPDGTVPLNVRVAAKRAYSRTGLADISAQKQHISDQPDVCRAFIVLGNPHPVGNDGGVGFRIGLGHLFERSLAEPGLALNVIPARLRDVGGKVIKAPGVFCDKRVVEHVTAFGLHFQQVFGHTFQRGGIASGLHRSRSRRCPLSYRLPFQ